MATTSSFFVASSTMLNISYLTGISAFYISFIFGIMFYIAWVSFMKN